MLPAQGIYCIPFEIANFAANKLIVELSILLKCRERLGKMRTELLTYVHKRLFKAHHSAGAPAPADARKSADARQLKCQHQTKEDLRGPNIALFKPGHCPSAHTSWNTFDN